MPHWGPAQGRTGDPEALRTRVSSVGGLPSATGTFTANLPAFPFFPKNVQNSPRLILPKNAAAPVSHSFLRMRGNQRDIR